MPRDRRIPGRQQAQTRRAARGRKPVLAAAVRGGPARVASRPRAGRLAGRTKPGNRLAEERAKRYIAPIAAYRRRRPANK